jgi:hypothetical protein
MAGYKLYGDKNGWRQVVLFLKRSGKRRRESREQRTEAAARRAKKVKWSKAIEIKNTLETKGRRKKEEAFLIQVRI